MQSLSIESDWISIIAVTTTRMNQEGFAFVFEAVQMLHDKLRMAIKESVLKI